MESNNEWYLISVRKAQVKELKEIYLVCIYTNGLEEKQIEYAYGNQIPTILKPWAVGLKYIESF